MPYASKAQAGFFHANKKKLEGQGVDVAEWDKASKGKKLPDKVKKEAAAMLKEILARNVKLAERDQPCTEPGDTALSGKVKEVGREIEDKSVKKPTGESKMKPPGPTKPPEGMSNDGLKTAKVLAKAASEMTPEQRDYVMFGKKPTTSVQPTTAPPAPAAPVTAPASKAVAPAPAPAAPAAGNKSANDYVLFGGKKVAAAPSHLLAGVLILNQGK